MIREELLALADDVESTIGGCYGCLLDKRGLCKAETDFDCNDEVCKFVAHRLREIVEHEAEDVTTTSAYDLQPGEDRKAISWVREHGGIERCEAFVRQSAREHGYLLKIVEMLGTSIYDGSDNADALLEKLSERLMPEGLSWPVFEDGAPVSVGDEHETNTRGIERITGVEFLSEGCVRLHHGADWLASTQLAPGERVKRHAPKALDADGVEIREGDVLYSVETGDYVIVDSIEPGNPWFVITDGSLQHCAKFTHEQPVLDMDGVEIRVGDTVCGTRDMEPMRVVDTDSRECGFKHIKCEKEGDGFWFYCPDELTHKLPVIAADGKPLREGETVWDVESGTEYEVVGIHTDEDTPVRVMRTDGSHLAKAAKPSTLTHAKPEPDSWERIEEDATRMPGEYCERYGIYGDSFPQAEAMACDLVRRCRALAERGE